MKRGSKRVKCQNHMLKKSLKQTIRPGFSELKVQNTHKKLTYLIKKRPKYIKKNEFCVVNLGKSGKRVLFYFAKWVPFWDPP